MKHHQKKSGHQLEVLLHKISQPQYKGKHIVFMGGKIYQAKTGKGASKLVKGLTKKFPDQTPTLAYIPKTDSLILIFPCKK